MFVAGFIGSPAMNFFHGAVEKLGDGLAFRNEEMNLILPEGLVRKYEEDAGRKVVLGIRPHHIQDARLSQQLPGWEKLKAKVEVVEPLGNEVVLVLSLGGTQFRAAVDPHTDAKVHDVIEIRLDLNKMYLFDEVTEEVINQR